ncbi:MAG: trigger factor [Bryobacteraceae bacterium]|nr:trigger factor [Bryobacteraceae bacterium]
MALVEGCTHELEITIPAEAMAEESAKVELNVQKKAHLKGFRPGKAPISVIRKNFEVEIRQEVLENLIPKLIDSACEKEGLHVVSRPEVKDLHFHDDGSVHFKTRFDVAADFELNEVRGLEVAYAEPEVTDEDVEKRLQDLREARAELVNVDPRPAQDGDHCQVSLESIAGLDGAPIKQDDLNIEIGSEQTMAPFTEALRGAEPGDEREAEVSYPEDYAAENLAGKTVRFKITLKTIRLKEMPELNDEFAQDVGDFTTLEELKDEIRKAIFREREYMAQTEAKNALIEKLIDLHEFPVPESYVDQQLQNNLENQLRSLAAQGADVKKLASGIDWAKYKENQGDRARRDVRGSLVLGKIASSESIHPTQDEVDAEVQRMARQQREPVAAVRMKLEKDGSLDRIANRIRTEKVLSFLFEHAVKVAPAPVEEGTEGEAQNEST